MSPREIIPDPVSCIVTAVNLPTDATALHVALQDLAVEHGAVWLLAHADDGLVWGKVKDGALILAPQKIDNFDTTQLRLETLQRLWLFGPSGESYLWHDANSKQWNLRLITSGDTIDEIFKEAINESFLLYGTNPEGSTEDFTVMRDGAQGLRHAFPAVVREDYDEQSRPLKLIVRHYLAEDPETGFTRIALTRLINLEWNEHAEPTTAQ